MPYPFSHLLQIGVHDWPFLFAVHLSGFLFCRLHILHPNSHKRFHGLRSSSMHLRYSDLLHRESVPLDLISVVERYRFLHSFGIAEYRFFSWVQPSPIIGCSPVRVLFAKVQDIRYFRSRFFDKADGFIDLFWGHPNAWSGYGQTVADHSPLIKDRRRHTGES